MAGKEKDAIIQKRMDSVERSVANLLERCNPGAVPERRRRQRIHIYAKGVEAKVQQARFALDQLKNLSLAEESIASASTVQEFTNDKLAEFYNDCFWTFLYSAFDILGQVLNQVYDLRFDEKEVSIACIARHIITNNADPVAQEVKGLLRSRTFKTIQRYRHCSVHRRQIALMHAKFYITESYHYDTTGPFPVRKLLLCDDPHAISPKFRKQHDLVDFTEAHLARAEKKICKILNRLLI